MAAKRKAPVKKAPAKKTIKKRVGTSQTKKSMITKKKPSARLKARRASNIKPGYFPNPVLKRKKWVSGIIQNGKQMFVSKIIQGLPVAVDDDSKKATRFNSKAEAVKVARKIQDNYPEYVAFAREADER